MNEVPFLLYIFSNILTPVRKNTHTYENIFPLV